MREAHRFVGRDTELAELRRCLEEARSGRGGLVLVAGEAGVGKSRLVEAVLREGAGGALSAACVQADTSPYGPIVQVLRGHLRRSGRNVAAALGPLASHLAVLMPELGMPSEGGDRATLFEAMRRAFEEIAAAGTGAVFLDDLHWADDATLELLLMLGEWLEREPLLLLGAFRSDEIPRGHPVRRFRTELRRHGRLREIAVEPLSAEATAELAAEVLGRRPAPALAALLYERSQGVPFFVEELAAALVTGGGLREDPEGLNAAGSDVPLPESIRDAVLLRADSLSEAGRQALEVGSVMGVRFDAAFVGDLAGEEDALTESLDRGVLLEAGVGQLAFRHALTREAVYQEIPWPRRRSLHRKVAHRLEASGAPPETRAAHWVAAREHEPARRCLTESADAFCRVHAYRDAMRAARRALELWPEGEDENGRLAVLDRLGRCAELSGELAEAARAWGEVAEARRRGGNLYEYAELQRRLAAVYGLQGSWERALAAREAAAEAFASHGLPAEAAAERLAAAEHLDAAGSRRAALELVVMAGSEAAQGQRSDLVARALGLEGQLRVELGEGQQGIDRLREGLDLALVHELDGAAAELHYRLAWALSEVSDYATAGGAFQVGLDFCQARGVADAEQQCLACYAGVLVELGEWERAAAICRELLAVPAADPIIRSAAACVNGILQGLQGRPRPARRLLLEAEARSRRDRVLALDLSVLWGLAMADELEGETGTAIDRIRALRERWEATDDLYYVVHPLRWAATFLAGHGLDSETRACADVLASVAANKGSPEALAALAHALGECALLEGAAEPARGHFDHALDILKRLGIPFQHAHSQVRSAAALSAAGERDAAAARLAEAYQTARKLGAAPLATRAAVALRELGEPVEERLGRRAARDLDRAGLTRRELQVLRLVNEGRSNRDIARELFLSPRTVEMHVGNALLKLGCRTRTEAAHRARALGVIV